MATANIYDMVDTWNDGATTFTAIKMDVTDTASAAGSLLMDLQVGGSSRFKVAKDGNLTFGDGGTTVEAKFNASTVGQFLVGITPLLAMNSFSKVVSVASNGFFGFSGGGNNAPSQPADLILARDAANTLAQRNSTNAQTFNLYNTYTDASNYERGFIGWSREANTFYIGTEGAGTGSDSCSVKIRSNANVYDFSNVGLSISGVATNSAVSITGSNAKASFGTGSNFTYWGSESSDPLELRTSNNAKLKLDTVGSVEITTGLTVATLPGTPLAGMIARVTDGDSGLTFGNTVVNSGAGATPYLVWYNGTNWTVIGA
jgi:hypothetical protein